MNMERIFSLIERQVDYLTGNALQKGGTLVNAVLGLRSGHESKFDDRNT